MWRLSGSLQSYLYYPGKRNICGEDWVWNQNARDGEWMFQKTYVRLNTIGTALVRLLS